MPRLTQQSKDRKGWVCPICKHGEHGDGLVENKKSRKHGLKCFGACGFSGDVVALYQEMNQGKSFTDAVNELGNMLGIAPGTCEPKEKTLSLIGKKEEPQKPKSDHRAYYAECRKRLTDKRATDYLRSRGLSLTTAKTYGGGVGFDPAADVAGAGFFAPRLIIPSCDSHYIGRRTDGGKECRVLNSAGDEAEITGLAELEKPGAVFVCEGAFDGMSIMEAGGRVVVLNSTANRHRFLDYVEKHRPRCVLLLALDNDKAGNDAKVLLSQSLAEMKIPYRITDICREDKDLNDELVADRERFFAKVQEAINPGNDLAGFLERVGGKVYHAIPTGIDELDSLLGGGFMQSQLVLLGAPPAMGKTAVAQWLAEKSRARVQYYCFEMPADHLIARSLSRVMYEKDIADLSPAEVLQGKDMRAIREGVKTFSLIGGRVVYNPGVAGNDLCPPTLQSLLQAIDKAGECDIVVVDYLQLVNAGGRDEAENIQKTMAALKSLAVRKGITILAIMANNRNANRMADTSQFTGRGSSSLEYGADMILNLQFVDPDGEDKTRRKLTVAKGRFVAPEERLEFTFDGKHMNLKDLEKPMGRYATKRESRDIESLLRDSV